ncbi:hypothetical protein PR048_011603 [Dryococelus australis]|uniref:Uncharacterized protein n=1 Tax=Dryococelus australis TaxID=614101 RepID=A0ABQ9HM11_9NEOP|nr:hypothetical protein PR048_011603 [Dryococelus australis]
MQGCTAPSRQCGIGGQGCDVTASLPRRSQYSPDLEPTKYLILHSVDTTVFVRHLQVKWLRILRTPAASASKMASPASNMAQCRSPISSRRLISPDSNPTNKEYSITYNTQSDPRSAPQWPMSDRGVAVAERLACSPSTKANLGRVTSGFSQVGIVPDDAAGRRAFSGISCFPRPCIPAPLYSQFISPSTALKNSNEMVHAERIRKEPLYDTYKFVQMCAGGYIETALCTTHTRAWQLISDCRVVEGIRGRKGVGVRQGQANEESGYGTKCRVRFTPTARAARAGEVAQECGLKWEWSAGTPPPLPLSPPHQEYPSSTESKMAASLLMTMTLTNDDDEPIRIIFLVTEQKKEGGGGLVRKACEGHISTIRYNKRDAIVRESCFALSLPPLFPYTNIEPRTLD